MHFNHISEEVTNVMTVDGLRRKEGYPVIQMTDATGQLFS